MVRPEYSWKIARWTLNTNQSINQIIWYRGFDDTAYARAISTNILHDTIWPRYTIINIYQIENKYNIEIKIESYINTSISNGSIIYN